MEIPPNKLNYDLPLILQAVVENREKEDTTGRVVGCRKVAIQWGDITYIEEYPKAYEDLIDWKEWKGMPKTWVCTDDSVPIALVSFEEIIPYWEYYLKNVKHVEDYQTPNHKRSK